MSKSTIISTFKDAMSHHDFVTTRVRNAIKYEMEKEVAELAKEDDKFGDAMENPTYKLQELMGSIMHHNLMEHHRKIKEAREEIFEIIIKDIDSKKPKFNKLTPANREILKSKADDMGHIQDSMKRLYNASLLRLNALSEDKFE
ncbi:MAG: hypothetical protein GX282_01975 [Campylobacteraceae bacterium]|nr:hypothetical protein [Campylobacteraceae bacterium]